ncbi:MAG TPA: response regulator transcription factor [Candidatus Angelobacter sp.]|nr:response regulator transcription factor [Candidatus Angelobacter sp.]
MDKRSDTPPGILIVAGPAARRAALGEITSRALQGRVHLTFDSRISFERFAASKSDIVVADLDSPALAAAMVHFLEQAPAGTGSVALIDGPGPEWVRTALSSGINALIARDAGPEELQLALQAADAGLVLLHPTSVRGLMLENALPDTHDSPMEEFAEELTARENQVLRLMSTGLGNKEIAARLAISEHTVKFHISSILGKLNAASRTEAVSLGIRRGLVPI